jgi:ABC-type bacteriocin/lantibiotic exporter with double-glycine peptidase domain
LAGLGVMLPVIEIFTHSSGDSEVVMNIMTFFNITDVQTVYYLVLFIVGLFFVLKSFYVLYAIHQQQYFVNTVFKEVSSNTLENSLNLSYEEFLSKDKSFYLKNIVTSSGYLSVCTFNVLQLLTEILVISSVIIFLVFYLGFSKLFYFGIFIIIFAVFFKLVTKGVSKLGENRDMVMHQITKTATEALGGYREIRIDNVTNEILENYNNKITPYIAINSKHGVISSIPRIALETIVALIIVFYIFWIGSKDVGAELAIEELIIFAFVGIRILPSLNKILTSSANIMYFGSEVSHFESLFNKSSNDKIKKEVNFDKSIEMRKVCYAHPNSNELVLRNIDLKLEKGKKYGFVGESGSGKSTLFDNFLGFITPSSGNISIDGRTYDTFENLKTEDLISLVSQSVFVLDASFRDNIVFHKDQNFNEDKFVKAVEGSQMSSVIDGNYSKSVGENGNKLSGGQRQRLAIARSLYASKSILLLDEATSALDSQTEKNFMKYIDDHLDQTILIIAHRMSTIRNCDKIFVLDKGLLVAQGTYEYLLKNCTLFKELSVNESGK